jgi:D-glycero-D-manno-heptose 1,7-bisphosphate phosphatase
VARGYFSENAVRRVNQRILRLFNLNDAPIDGIFYCPHYLEGELKEYAIECRFRKPAPGMIEKACRKHNINPHRSYVIGDKLSDVNLAAVTGSRAILVQTGYGADEEKKLQNSNSIKPESIEKNLYQAVKHIINVDGILE